jgi:hypothetical protein
MSVFHFRLSDEEFIERQRRNLAQFDRGRLWLMGLYAALFPALLGVSYMATRFLNNVGQQFNVQGGIAGFGIGFAIGAGIGIAALKWAHGFIEVLVGYRSERLMIRFYDAFQELRERLLTESLDASDPAHNASHVETNPR